MTTQQIWYLIFGVIGYLLPMIYCFSKLHSEKIEKVLDADDKNPNGYKRLYHLMLQFGSMIPFINIIIAISIKESNIISTNKIDN